MSCSVIVNWFLNSYIWYQIKTINKFHLFFCYGWQIWKFRSTKKLYCPEIFSRFLISKKNNVIYKKFSRTTFVTSITNRDHYDEFTIIKKTNYFYGYILLPPFFTKRITFISFHNITLGWHFHPCVVIVSLTYTPCLVSLYMYSIR